MRVLGLDVGSHRIGVALSDEDGSIAQPLTTVKVADDVAAASRQIGELCEEHEVEKIVVGLPLSLGGGDGGESVARARRLGRRLAEQLGVDVVYWDERFSTAEAERMLVGARMRRGERRQVVDRVAASLILGAYLDSLRSATDDER